MIHIQKLHKKYPNENGTDTVIYEWMDLEIADGRFIWVLWKSGTGKTTLLNLLSGLDNFNAGSIDINGNQLENMTDEEKTAFRAKHISFIFQQFNLIDNLTVKENIDLIIDLNKIERQYDTKELLEIVWLWDKLDAYPYNLSGGEQQRVAVARAFVGKTSLLLADEPTWNLDEANSDIVMNLIQKLHKDTGNTIIMITHDLEIAKLADTSFFLENHILVEKKI